MSLQPFDFPADANVIVGTELDDSLTGTFAADGILGQGRDDRLIGGARGRVRSMGGGGW